MIRYESTNNYLLVRVTGVFATALGASIINFMMAASVVGRTAFCHQKGRAVVVQGAVGDNVGVVTRGVFTTGRLVGGVSVFRRVVKGLAVEGLIVRNCRGLCVVVDVNVGAECV